MIYKRLMELLSKLSESEYITAEYLAKGLGVSVKTVRTRIKEANALLKDNGALIDSKSHYGYRLIVTDSVRFECWKGQEQNEEKQLPSSQGERVQYLLAYLLQQDDYVKMDDLSDFLYISKNILTQCLKRMEVQVNQYGLQIERRPNYGIRLRGSEFDIRRCIRDLIIKKKDAGSKSARREKEMKELADFVLKKLHIFGIRLSEIAFENFIEDAYVAVRRIRQGHLITDCAIGQNDIKENEWKFIQDLTAEEEQIYNITYTKEEQMYMAVHLAGRRTVGESGPGNDNFVIREDIDGLVIRMLELICQEMNLDFKNNFELRMSLNQHMVPMDIRLRYDIPLENPMLDHIREKFAMAYAVAVHASAVLREYYKKEIPAAEIGYLALLFALALEQQDQQNQPGKKMNILIVCSSGRGSTKLLKYLYAQEFKGSIGQIFTCDLYELEEFDLNHVDYVFTTVPITRPISKPILEVGLFLEQRDIEKVRRALEDGNPKFLGRYYKHRNFIRNLPGKTREEVLKNLCCFAVSRDPLPSNLYDFVMEREYLVATDFGNHVAVPHPASVLTDKTYVYVAFLENPVFWDRQEVWMVILTVIGRKTDPNIQSFYKATMKLISNEQAVNTLREAPSYHTFMALLITGRDV